MSKNYFLKWRLLHLQWSQGWLKSYDKKIRELSSKEDGYFKNHGIKQRACEGSLNVIIMFALDSISKHNKGTMFQMSREYIYPPVSFIQI